MFSWVEVSRTEKECGERGLAMRRRKGLHRVVKQFIPKMGFFQLKIQVLVYCECKLFYRCVFCLLLGLWYLYSKPV